jgi:outer membrane lipase/esterase
MNLLTLLRHGRRAALVLTSAALVAACGGGVSSDDFEPVRILSFGDEASVLDDSVDAGNARKYSVNGLDDDDEVDCTINRIWVQVVAASYGHTFPECNPLATADLPSRAYAVPGARVADVEAQITAHLAGGSGFNADDLVTVFVGTHDVLDAYARFTGDNTAQLVADIEARGVALGAQINRIAAAGGKVLVVTVPDLGKTPFGRAEETAHPDEGRAALLRRLSERFNARMRTSLPDDGGRSIGLVLYNELISAVLDEDSTLFSNKKDPVCDATKAPVLTSCTNDTLVTGADTGTYVWADQLWPAAGIQARLGTLASNQSRRNPF